MPIRTNWLCIGLLSAVLCLALALTVAGARPAQADAGLTPASA